MGLRHLQFFLLYQNSKVLVEITPNDITIFLCHLCCYLDNFFAIYCTHYSPSFRVTWTAAQVTLELLSIAPGILPDVIGAAAVVETVQRGDVLVLLEGATDVDELRVLQYHGEGAVPQEKP